MTGSDAVLVAVGGSGRDLGTVEAGASLASAFGVPWHAMFVETPRTARDPGIAERAGEALAHAAELGATVSREPATSVAQGLDAHLTGAPACHLVIGAPARLWRRRSRLADTFLRDLLARRPDLAVHIAPAAAPMSGGDAARRVAAAPRLRDYAITLALVLVTVALCKALLLVTTGRPLSLLFLFPVITAAARFGLRPALVAVAASIVGFDLFVLLPLWHLEPLAPVNIILWVALGGVAIYTSMITGALRGRVALSDRSAQESARIVAFSQSLIGAAGWAETAQVVCEEFATTFDAQVMLFREMDGQLVCESARPSAMTLGAVGRGALAWCWTNGKEAGIGTHAITSAEWRFEPLRTSLGMLAVVALARADGGDPIRADRRLLFTTLVNQAALAHERLLLQDQYRRPTET